MLKKQKLHSNFKVIIFLLVLNLWLTSAYSQEMQKIDKDSIKGKSKIVKNEKTEMDEEEIPHPFFTHMGMPEATGVYSLRVQSLLTNVNNKTVADFGFHLETGLSKFVGMHIRNDRFLDNTHRGYVSICGN